MYFLDNRRLRQLCVLLFLLAPVLRGSMHFQSIYPVYMLTPFRMDLLAAGSLLSLEWRSRREGIERWGAAAGLSLASVGLAGMLVLAKFGYTTSGNTRMGNVLIYESCLLIAVGMIIYALGGRGTGWLRIKPMTYIGTISYSMYLVHVGIIALVSAKFHGFVATIIALALTIAYAAVSWVVIESPLLGRKHAKVEPQLNRA